jgi:hypothetical protein
MIDELTTACDKLATDFARLSDHFAISAASQTGEAKAGSLGLSKAYTDAATRLLALLPEGTPAPMSVDNTTQM